MLMQMAYFVHFSPPFVGKKGEVIKQPPHYVGLLPLVASHEKNWAGVECQLLKKKRSCSDKRKKESGVVAGEPEIRCDSSERQTLQTPAAAPSLSAAATSCWRRSRRCSLEWPGSGVQGTAVVRLNLIREQEQGSRFKGLFSVWFLLFFPSVMIPLRDSQ